MKRKLSAKERAELDFWESRVPMQGVLSNDHYEYFYTANFSLDKAFYAKKSLLDIGCGPRGSLEWADNADRRVGLDPLADQYRTLGADRHAMQYVVGEAERIPFSSAQFDIVCSFNSLDHVDDLEQSVAEIIRVIRPGGLFLLITDIHRLPTVLEPSAYSWEIADRFLPGLEVVEQRHCEYSVFSPEGFGDIYQSLQKGVSYDHEDPSERYGILSAQFRKPISR